MADTGWRYLAQRLDGSGINEVFFDADIPLAGASITDVLSGPTRIEGNISPAVARLKGSDGRPLLQKWGTAIYAELDGEIRAGAIVTDSSFSGPEWSLTCLGFTGYAIGMPYTGGWFGVEVDPTDVLREIWRNLQQYGDSNLGLIIDPLLTGIEIGQELEQVEFDTENGPVSFEAGPIKLADYLDQDMGNEIDNLVRDTPFDFHEEHSWNPGQNSVRHYMRLGYPRIGRRRDDLRFVLGENIMDVPEVSDAGDDYASEILVLGAGEGRDMLRTRYGKTTGRLRRVTTVTDKDLRSLTTIKARAEREYQARAGVFGEVTQVAVRQHSHAEIGSWEVGDEILIQAETDWADVEQWVRIVSSTIVPENGDIAVLEVARPDTVT